MFKMLVLVTGSRSWTDREAVRAKLQEIYDRHGSFQLIHGGAPGLDTIAGEEYFSLFHEHAIVKRPDYERYYFKIAPKMRNVEMVDMLVQARKAGEEVQVIGFKDLNSATGGTNHCIEEANLMKLPVETIKKVAS